MSTRLAFVDRAKIFIKAGDGGDGVVSFFRAKYIPKGGPDGGDGGRGGSIIVRASKHLSTLRDFQKKRHFKAQNGKNGQGQQKTGASGEDLVIDVPLGTVILDEENKNNLGEVLEHDQSFVLQEGGKGGLGNIHFKSSTNQAPRKATKGKDVEGLWVIAELRLLSDFGLVGFPNAGKSTLLTAISKARPKVADYPFTTLSPHLGVVMYKGTHMTVADLPGLIEGAHQGHGLGFEFLRHVQRTKTLIFVLQANPLDLKQPFVDYKALIKELRLYDEKMLQKKQIIVINKVDLLNDQQKQKLMDTFHNAKKEPIMISAKLGTNLDELFKSMFQTLKP